MAVPKKRRSKSRKRTHRSMWKIALPTVVPCPNCGVLMVTHRACMACGHYKGRPVVAVKINKQKKEG